MTEKNPEKSKKGLYKIKDNFLLFWFKFIFPNLSFIESGNEIIAMKKIQKNLVDNHISFIYEDICIEEMWKLNGEGKWDFNFDKIGRWWNNDTEIDIVAFETDGNEIIYGECKFLNTKVGTDVLFTLEQKSKKVEWNKLNRKNNYIIFSISGFTDELIKLAKERKDIVLWQ